MTVADGDRPEQPAGPEPKSGPDQPTVAAEGSPQVESTLESEPPSGDQNRDAARPLVGSQKRRSSWRHFLSPSYKSRSDEFHKLFASELPRGERLLADYSCALHREILLQGRLYVSLNHLAFYSNIFTWVTKLVVRLQDIRDIQKANTAKIIPNAIQIITEQGDKHVFASLIARDKTFTLVRRIWRSSSLIGQEQRLTDQELRRLVHLGYGKDLGFGSGDLDEVQMLMSTSSGTSTSSSNTSPEGCSHEANRPFDRDDDNNNTNNNSGRPAEANSGDRGANQRQPGAKLLKPLRMRLNSRSHTQKEVLSLIEETEADGADKSLSVVKLGRSPGSMPSGLASGGAGSLKARPSGGVSRRQSDRVVRHLSMRFANLSSLSYRDDDDDDDGDTAADQEPGRAGTAESETPRGAELEADAGGDNDDDHDRRGGSLSPPSSAVVVDTPLLVAADRIQRAIAMDLAELEAVGAKQTEAEDTGERAERQVAPIGTRPASSDGGASPQAGPRTHLARGTATATTAAAADQLESCQGEATDANGGQVVECGCDEHVGSLIADEQFDIGVDLLFSLIFTNSKFMRAHMVRRGMTRSIVSKWRRGGPSSQATAANNTPDGKGTRSGSSTLSSQDGATSQWSIGSKQEGQRTRQNSLDSLQTLDRQAAKVRSEQERQLSYSMNVNHMLAKQVQVEERQSICLARAGQLYVLKSTTLNSGFPCSESFTIDLTYCLTRGHTADQSRMKVHGLVNFIKEKNSWRLSMVKSMLEKTSMQGVHEFISELGQSIRNYAAATSKRRTQRKRGKTSGVGTSSSSCQDQADQQQQRSQRERRDSAATPTEQPARGASRDHKSSTRAKSKLKERKLRNMYKYYIRAGDDEPLQQEREAPSADLSQPARQKTRPSGRHRRRWGVSPSRRPPGDPELSSSSSSSSATSASVCSSSSGSSLLCDENEHDNDSMLIMMTTTNDDEDQHHHLDDRPKLARTANLSNRLAHSGDPIAAALESCQRGENPARRRQQPAACGHSFTTKNLVMGLGGGLLLLLTGAVFVLNALILRRLDRLELTIRTILDRDQ